MTGRIRPLIIVGAARSGTNILRNMLTSGPAATTWPCDEINYIWRHGNKTLDHDELTTDHARPRVTRYIRRAFAKQARRGASKIVVEKTCATTLRVPFIDAVLPEARYVVIERNALDAVASAMQRWRAPLETDYLAAKARYVPALDLPYYASRYGYHRLKKVVSKDDILPTWGPRFRGIDDLVATQSLATVCATQWAHSVRMTREALPGLRPDQVYEVAYEELAQDPGNVASDLSQFMLGRVDSDIVDAAERMVSPASVGKGRAMLSDQETRDATAALERVLG